jgi:ppGpp synthetase/RelA/SpoT-type nucleotidyltranferase
VLDMSSSLSPTDQDGLLSRLRDDQEFRNEFHVQYLAKSYLLDRHIDRLINVLEDKKIGLGSSQMIKHAKITARVKKEESAIKTLERRQKECLALGRMKSRLEACDQSWEEYWARQVATPWWVNQFSLYQSIEEMLSALPDIGGIRICVYSPEDIDKVLDFLNSLYKSDRPNRAAGIYDRTDLLAKPPQVIRRGQGPDHVHDLKHHVESLERDFKLQPSATDRMLHYQDQFPGYRATHVRVQLKPDLVDDEVQLNGYHTVEIQILTVIMDAWAQVVHGLTYKPDLPPPDSLRILLDQLGGIVLLGETTLTQVSRVQTDIEVTHTQSQGATPSSWYELGAWLARACKSLEPDSPPNTTSSSPKFGKLDELLKVLSVTDEHTYKNLQRLLEKTIKDHGREVINVQLPIHLMRAWTKEQSEAHPMSPVIDDDEDNDKEIFFRRTRRKAQKVVHIINMAGFLDIVDDFVKYTHRALEKLTEREEKNPKSKTPSMIEMLDLLHHSKPQARNASSMSRIQDFCHAFCEKSCLADVVKDQELLARLELPRMLVNAGYVARPIFEDTAKGLSQEQTTVIPRDLCAFLDDVDDTHFIPEILNVAQKIAEREPDRDPSPDREPATTGNGILASAAGLTKWLGSRRMRFEPKNEEEDFFRVLVDRMEVPMRSRFDQTERTMVLEIDKHKEQIWPHPGFFSTTMCTKRDHDHGKLPRWKYIESKASDWSIRKLRDERASREIRDKPSGENNFLRLFRRLHIDCAPIEPVDDDPEIKQYRFLIKNKRFCVSSTPEKYILKEETRPQRG